MPTIVGISGSLRRGSYNTALLRAAVALTPAGCAIELASIKGIPLYDGDLETEEGIPEVVVALKDLIAAADGLLLVTPEYNNSIPGTFKNAIDWLSRPGSDIPRVFGNKPVGLIGATPGGLGTAFSQTAWLAVLRALGTRPYFGHSLYVSGASKIFDEQGQLTDERLRERLRDYLVGFAGFMTSARAVGT